MTVHTLPRGGDNTCVYDADCQVSGRKGYSQPKKCLAPLQPSLFCLCHCCQLLLRPPWPLSTQCPPCSQLTSYGPAVFHPALSNDVWDNMDGAGNPKEETLEATLLGGMGVWVREQKCALFLLHKLTHVVGWTQQQ